MTFHAFFFRRLFLEIKELTEKLEKNNDEYVMEVLVEPDKKVVSSK